MKIVQSTANAATTGEVRFVNNPMGSASRPFVEGDLTFSFVSPLATATKAVAKPRTPSRALSGKSLRHINTHVKRGERWGVAPTESYV